MSARRVVAGLLAMMLGAAVLSIIASSPPPAAAAADPAQTGSAVTVPGKGDFAHLTVTVSQTRNLINQTVTVSWTGGTPTVSNTDFAVDYLQIMQCWGDDPAGPDRTQCQFGAAGSQDADDWVGTRQVSYGYTLTDPNERTFKQPKSSSDQAYVPFWAVGTTAPTVPATSNRNDFFDSQVTNEIPLARTHGDGTGQEFFEVETVREAAGLGCGDPVTTGGATTGRSCWLVVVPRGDKEVDGSIRNGSGTSHLSSSPLSQSNWNNRIMVPLKFQPVGQACPIGSPERSLIGHEMAVEAVTSWQPALCAGGGTLFSYTQLTDDVARSQAQNGRLALVNEPIPADQVLAGHPLVYAPVGLSGLAIAFNIDHQPPADAPADVLQLNGQRFTSMKLTPRLVAKLLTQSYRNAVGTGVAFSGYLKNNPFGLLADPEFLTLNPGYKGFVDPGTTVPDALVQLNGADVTSLLWSWVKADPDASAFLAGKKDPFGMVVNPRNVDLALPTSTFPRNDQSCDILTDGPVSYQQCALDNHPFATDMHDAGRSASRGDSLARNTVVDPTTGQPVSTKGPRQPAGHQALLAVVDTASAARYGLPTAQLLNAAGTFVAPTTESLLAGEAAMTPSAVPGVLTPDPTATDPAAYPLTALSYAVTSPSMLDPAAAKDYATFLRYAGGKGQQQGLDPGQLPLGMVPLPGSLKAQTIAAATTIEAQTTPSPRPTTGTPQNVTGGLHAAARAGGDATNSGGSRSTGMPAAVAAPSGGPPATAPSVAQSPVARARRTPSLPATAVGALLVAILIVGAVATTSAPVTQWLSGGLRRRRRRGVTPTER